MMDVFNTKKIISLILCLAITLSAVVVIADETADTPILDNGEAAKKLVEQSATLITSQYKDEVSREELYEKTLMAIMESHPELIEEAYNAMFSSLDDHTCYYTEEEYKYFTDSMSGEFSGIGVVISELPEGLLVTSTTAESPAAQAGVKIGDIIVAADGTSIAGMPLEKARTFIVGEIGSLVTIRVLREGEYLDFAITRQPVVVEPGFYEIIDGSIGYIALDSFDESSPILVNHALDHFDNAKITNIIIDLRYNPGGSVQALVEICQRLIPKGPIIHFEFQDKENVETLYSQCQNPKYSIIALTNEYSASASEAFCGAIQDSGVGIVVGDVTYGKGTMQNLFDFRIGGGVKMTLAEYLTRDKRRINQVGITPDYTEYDKVTTMKYAGFEDFDFETKMKIGDKGSVVLALNQRLSALGYDVGIPKDEFTQDTHNAVYHFQRVNDLYPYGVCDITTQLAIQNQMQTHEFSDNRCLKTALEIFRTGTFKKYVGAYKK